MKNLLMVLLFNLDETARTTFKKLQRVLALAGKKCLGKVTIRERVILVTTCCFKSAGGFTLPSNNSLGLATQPWWMNTAIFVDVIKHFIKCSNGSPENESLAICAKNVSYLSIKALNLAEVTGVAILTLHLGYWKLQVNQLKSTKWLNVLAYLKIVLWLQQTSWMLPRKAFCQVKLTIDLILRMWRNGIWISKSTCSKWSK